MIRTLSIFAFLAVAASANAETLTLSSHYNAVGTNADGSKYTGVAAVKILSDTTFGIEWTIGGVVYKGFGMRRNDALAATYMINGQPGLVIYKVDGNELDGLWSVRGQNGSGSEHLTPID
jgi:hypothetical protein